MLIDLDSKLTFIASTKSASTSVENLLQQRPRMGRLIGDPRLKHTTFERYLRMKQSLLAEDNVTWTIIRHPRDKLVSWFRYRSRAGLIGKDRYLGDRSLADYIATLSDEDRDDCDDRKYVLSGSNRVDIVFKYEALDEAKQFISTVYPDAGEIAVKNASKRTVDVTPDLIQQIDDTLIQQIDWYERLTADTCESALATYRSKIP